MDHDRAQLMLVRVRRIFERTLVLGDELIACSIAVAVAQHLVIGVDAAANNAYALVIAS